MELKLTLRADGDAEDVLVDVAGDSTIGELARGLFADAVPLGATAAELGLAVDIESSRSRVIDPCARVDESGLLSGSSVGPGTVAPTSAHAETVATLTLHDGPDAPANFELSAGRTSLGRGRDRDIRLTDALASKRHAEIIVGDAVEIVDDASANGLMMSGSAVTRAILRDGDRVVVGATTISVTHHCRRSSHRGTDTNNVAVIRSPRLDPSYQGIQVVAPEPPRPPAPHRFPIAMAIAPVALAAVLYLFTQNLLSILFFALSPVLLVGSWFETRSANKKQIATESARFRVALDDLAAQLEYAQRLERVGRQHEHPSVVDVIEAVDARGPLVWARRPEHDSFAHVRLGLGTQPSRNRVEMPTTNATLPPLWHELSEVVERFINVDRVPVIADMGSCGNVGVTGPDSAAEPVVRGLLAQFVGLHSPVELHLAGFASGDSWDWMKWLPHTDESSLAVNAGDASSLAARLEPIIDERLAARSVGEGPPPLPVIVVFIHDDAPIDRSRLVQIAERGPEVAVHVVWFASAVERLPAACRAFVEVDASTGRGSAGFVQGGRSVTDLAVEPLGAAAATRLAKLLSPMIDSGAPIDTASVLPPSVAFVELIGDEVATTPSAIIDRWREGDPASSGAAVPLNRGLRAVVGRTADGPLHIDLRADGPHALVGGTTGSGKSEFLQSWILAMATDNSPARVTFLLVDYKGGAAFAECVELPHCVGLVTDLSEHLVRRALSSLRAELMFREQLLHDRQAKDLMELERRGDPDCPPSLVIVIDEFAALLADVPEFVDGVVDIAQRGRSLGLHLVLATQRPGGVIGDNLRANTNLRIALRMADEADSVDVIGTSQAAGFDPAVPGRAILKAGPGRVTTFQAAYSGGHRAGRETCSPIEVRSLRFGSGETRSVSPPAEVYPTRPTGPTDIERIVSTIRRAAESLAIPVARRPWLPELATVYQLEALPTGRTDTAFVFGVADHPDAQKQSPVAFVPDVDGNLAVFGTGGTGKSATLRSIAVGAGFGSARGGPTWVYGLDFGSRGLHPLVPLPHVGSVIPGDDAERIQRLLRSLEEMIESRSARYATAEATTITEYRQRTGDHTEPRVLLLVDGVGAFRAEYEGGLMNPWWELFVRIAAEGRALGIHVVMSADRPSSVPSNLASSIQRRLVLRLANEMDAAMVDAPVEALRPGTPPGRGFLDGIEVQVGVMGGTSDLAGQGTAIDLCVQAMNRAGVGPAPAIEPLPGRIWLTDLSESSDHPSIGMSDVTLAAVGFEPIGTFLVAGPPRSGTTTTVITMVQSLAAMQPMAEFALFSARRSTLMSSVGWAASAHGPADVERLATRLTERLPETAGRPIVVVIEGVGDLLNTEADVALQTLLRGCREHDAFVIAEGETSGLTGSWPLLQSIKASRSGIALQPDQMDGDALFSTPFPRTARREFPAGRGLMVQGGLVTKVQVALPQ